MSCASDDDIKYCVLCSRVSCASVDIMFINFTMHVVSYFIEFVHVMPFSPDDLSDTDLNWKVIAIRWLGFFRVNVEYHHGMIYLQAVGQMAKILPIMQNFVSQYQQIDSSNHGIYIYFFFVRPVNIM